MATFLRQYEGAIWWIALFSGVVFVGSLVVVPWLVVKIPDDYFVTRRRPKSKFADEHPLLRWTARIIKNLVGVILILGGIAMLLLPGQGLVTLVIGILLLDFPGKHRLERKLIAMPPVLKSINWMRQRRQASPLRLQ